MAIPADKVVERSGKCAGVFGTPSWRSLYPPHPCADVFPMMTDEELDALGTDIGANGLKHPVVVWHDARADSWCLLDGRNRLTAVDRLGLPIPPTPTGDGAYITIAGRAHRLFDIVPNDTNLAAHVISANIRRRHLSKEQQAALIVAAVEAGETFDRATVARSKRARSFNPSGKRGGSTKDPVLAKAVTEAAKHGISKRTVQSARAKLNGTVAASRKTTAPAKHTVQAPTLPAAAPPTLAEHLRALLAELRARRQSNRDERGRRRWDPTEINIRFQTETLDWVEQTIARLVGDVDGGKVTP